MKSILVKTIVITAFLSSFGWAQKELPPEGGKPRDFSLPQKQQFTLENGVAVTLVPFGTIPKVTISVVVRTGNLNEEAHQVWLADVVGDMMKEGTTSRSATQIAQEAAQMGGDVSVNVTPDQSTISGDVLSEFGPKFIALIGDVVRNPLFPESELERIKIGRVRDLNVNLAQPGSLAQEAFMRALYPDHPYGRVFPKQADLEQFTIDDVKGFYEKNFGAQRTAVFVAGVFDAKVIEKAIRHAFEGWEKGPAVLVNVPKARTGQSFHLVERPGAPQSTIYFGLPVIDKSDNDYVKLVVTNSLLGGSFASRITSNIREKKGYTYSPYSMVSNRYRSAFWAEVADVGTEVTGPALKEIIAEINQLQSEPPSADELKGIQNYLAGTFVLQNSTRQGIIGQLNDLRLHGLPDVYLSNYVKNVHAVTPGDVQKTTQKYIRDEDMALVIVGDKAKVEEQIKDFVKVNPEGK